ncbi:MAG: hypothetical protein ABL931_11590 [Usitatibacteraceae bacterium]
MMPNIRPPSLFAARAKVAALVFGGFLVGALALTWLAPLAVDADESKSPPSVTVPVAGFPPVPAPAIVSEVRRADFGAEKPSADARQIADWIAESRNNGNMEFIIVDKKSARMFTFDARAKLRAASVVLLGAAKGDDSLPGIGSKPIAQVRPSERTTPAGRFVAERGHNTLGHDIIWVDYDAAVSMHRVRTANAKEQRLARLATTSIEDKRISYGCINVPAVFYDAEVRPMFATKRALVYVLPEIKTLQQVFGSYVVADTPSM